MKIISKFFKEFDFFSAPVSLRIQDEPEMKSFPIGLASFLMSILFVYIFISTFVSTVKYQKITSSLQETVIPENDTHGYVQAIAIGIDQLSYQEMSQMFILFYYSSSDGVFSQQYVRMRPCQPQLWSGLGDGYQSKFYQYKLENMVCVDQTFPFQIKKSRQSLNSSNIGIELVPCTFYSFPPSDLCNLTKASQYILSNTPKISIYILDTGLYPDQRNCTKPFVNMDAKFYISGEISSSIDIEFSSYRIQTDTSLLPFERTEIIEGIKIGNVRNSIKQYNINAAFSFIGSITITMNQNQQVYQRQIGKLDQLLSYVGGLFGILIAFIAFFLSKFNEYRYELKVAQRIISFPEDHKVKESDFNLFAYVKYGVYDWIKTLFCTELDWDQCKKIDEARDLANSQMEVNRFYKRIQNAETALIYIDGQDKADLIKIQEPTLFKRVQQRKLKLDYYSKVVKKQRTKKMSDLVTAEEALHEFFKKLLNEQVERQHERQNNEDVGNISRIIQEKLQPQNPELKNLKFSKELKQKSQSVKLPNEFVKIEQDLSNSLYALGPKRTSNLLKELPLLIVYRLIAKKTQEIRNSQQK